MIKGILVIILMLFAAVWLITGLFAVHYGFYYLKDAGASNLKILAIIIPVTFAHSLVLLAVVLFVKWKIDGMEEGEQ